MAEYRFDKIREQMESARDSADYEAIARLDKQLHRELSAADMKQLASDPAQLHQLTELLDWYRSVIEVYELERNDLRKELSCRTKNKSAVGRYQEVAFGSAI
ncbi:MAG: hypothetical protein KUG72_08190 [Pseudomonadales bacterium]|nr:hypothetical protein [Pseudomonadales bacterium]